MTCCVASICDNGKTLVIVADRMIGIIQSEPDITKLRELYKHCWVLFLGDDISSVFDVIDNAKDFIRERQPDLDRRVSLQLAMDAIREGHRKKRMQDAEGLYLKPIGLDLPTFHATGPSLHDFDAIKQRIEAHSFPIMLLVAGFSEEHAFLFSLSGYGEERGLTKRHDVPGFFCIGSLFSWEDQWVIATLGGRTSNSLPF